MGKEYPVPVVEGFDSYMPLTSSSPNLWRARRLSDGLAVVLKGESAKRTPSVNAMETLRFNTIKTRFQERNTREPTGFVPFTAFISGETGTYVVTPYIRPTNYVFSGQSSMAEKIQMGVVMTDTLASVHRADHIFYDAKIANWIDVSVPESPYAILADFESATPRSSDSVPLGTFEYSSPEQLRGEPDRRADVYALGTNLYELLTRRNPFVLPSFDFFPDAVAAVLIADYKERTQPNWNVLGGSPEPVVKLIKSCFDKAQNRPSLLDARRELMYGLDGLGWYD